MLLAGPRALYVIGRDFSAFRWLGQENRYSVPANAVVLQIALTLLLIVTSTFDSIIIFSGAILALNSLVTVLGVCFCECANQIYQDHLKCHFIRCR